MSILRLHYFKAVGLLAVLFILLGCSRSLEPRTVPWQLVFENKVSANQLVNITRLEHGVDYIKLLMENDLRGNIIVLIKLEANEDSGFIVFEADYGFDNEGYILNHGHLSSVEKQHIFKLLGKASFWKLKPPYAKPFFERNMMKKLERS